MKKHILISLFSVLLPLFVSSTEIQVLQKIELKDQFDATTQIDEKTKWIVFSTDKYISDLINKSLEDLKLTDLAKSNGAYVADISAMPGMVTTMFALPKMKKYHFKVVLDREGDLTGKWPQKKEKASLIKLDQLKITSVQQTGSFEEIKKFISDNAK
jgi:hypothetical protein